MEILKNKARKMHEIEDIKGSYSVSLDGKLPDSVILHQI